MHILYFLFWIAAGVAMVIYSFTIVRFFGRMDWAERYLGVGGTYTMWKLIGIACIIGAVWELVKG